MECSNPLAVGTLAGFKIASPAGVALGGAAQQAEGARLKNGLGVFEFGREVGGAENVEGLAGFAGAKEQLRQGRGHDAVARVVLQQGVVWPFIR